MTSRTLTGLSEYRVRRAVCEAWSLVTLAGEGGRVVACALQKSNKLRPRINLVLPQTDLLVVCCRDLGRL